MVARAGRLLISLSHKLKTMMRQQSSSLPSKEYDAAQSRKLQRFPARPVGDGVFTGETGIPTCWLGQWVSIRSKHWGGAFAGLVVGLDTDLNGLRWVQIAFEDEMHAQLEINANLWHRYIPDAEYKAIRRTASNWLDWPSTPDDSEVPWACQISRGGLPLPRTDPRGTDCLFFSVLASLLPAHYLAFCAGVQIDTSLDWYASWKPCLAPFHAVAAADRRMVVQKNGEAGNTGRDMERYLGHLKKQGYVRNYFFVSKRILFHEMYSSAQKGMVFMVIGWPPKSNVEKWIANTLKLVASDNIEVQSDHFYEEEEVTVNKSDGKRSKVTRYKHADKWEGTVKHTIVVRCLGDRVIVYDNQHDHSRTYSIAEGLQPLVSKHIMCIIDVYRLDIDFTEH